MFFVAPGANFDFASFSFQLPVWTSAARHRARPAKKATKDARMVRVLIVSPLLFRSRSGAPNCCGKVYNARTGRAGGGALLGTEGGLEHRHSEERRDEQSQT